MKEENKENINDYERNYYNLKYDKEKMHNEDVLFQKKKINSRYWYQNLKMRDKNWGTIENYYKKMKSK